MVVNSLPVDSLSALVAGLAAPSTPPAAATAPSTASTSSLLADFAKLLASQTSLAGADLESLIPSDSSDGSDNSDSDSTFSALMAPAASGLGQIEALVTLRLIDALDRLVSREAPAAPAGQQEPSGLPVTGPITQTFHPGHTGIDIAVPLGTPVHATMAGTVSFAGWNTEGYGNLVIVKNGSYSTYYAHLEQIPVAVGQTVAAGDVIGLSGSTGHSTGPHVHYEVRVDGKPVSPVPQT